MIRKFTEYSLNEAKQIPSSSYPTDMEWISVEGFLPSHASNVLVCGNGQHEVTFYSNRTNSWHSNFDVEYWMPLPLIPGDVVYNY